MHPFFHKRLRRILLYFISASILTACKSGGGSWENIHDIAFQEPDHSIRARFESVTETKAMQISRSYLANLKSHGRFSEDSWFTPYYFEAKDLSERFRFKNFKAADASAPPTIDVEFDNGLTLRFCFHERVVNIKHAIGRLCEVEDPQPTSTAKLEREQSTDRASEPSDSKDNARLTDNTTTDSTMPDGIHAEADVLRLDASRVFNPKQWPVSELPGVAVAETIAAELSWPPRRYLDTANTIPAPEGKAVVASAPIVSHDSRIVGWFAFVVPLSDTYPDTLGKGLLVAKNVMLVRILNGKRPETFFEIKHEKRHDDPSLFSDTRLKREISLKTVGDKLVEFRYPTMSVDYDVNDDEIFVDERNLRWLNLIDKTPKRIDLNERFDCHSMELRDVNGDHKPETFCLFYRDSPLKDTGQTGCPPVFFEKIAVYTEIAPLNGRDGWTEVDLPKQPGLHAVEMLSKRLGKSKVSYKTLRDAYGLANTLLLRSGRSLVFPPGDAVLDKILSLIAQNRGSLDVWRCNQTFGDSEPNYVETMDARLLDWPKSDGALDMASVTIRWEGEDTLVIGDGRGANRCTSKGCTETSAFPVTRQSRTSPNGEMIFLSIASRPRGVTLVLKTKRSENFDDSETISGVALQPCWGMDEETLDFDNKDDWEGQVVATYERVSCDGVLNGCDPHCCVGEKIMFGGHGFVGWLDNDTVLYAADAMFYALSIKKRLSKRLDVSEVPDQMLPYAGVTADRRYRFFIDNRNVMTPVTLWRIDLQDNSSVMILGNRHSHKQGADWIALESGVMATPASWVIPSPSGKKVALVVGGKVMRLVELSDRSAQGRTSTPNQIEETKSNAASRN